MVILKLICSHITSAKNTQSKTQKLKLSMCACVCVSIYDYSLYELCEYIELSKETFKYASSLVKFCEVTD